MACGVTDTDALSPGSETGTVTGSVGTVLTGTHDQAGKSGTRAQTFSTHTLKQIGTTVFTFPFWRCHHVRYPSQTYWKLIKPKIPAWEGVVTSCENIFSLLCFHSSRH